MIRKKHPKFTAFICLFTTIAALALIVRILVLFNIESDRLVEIWQLRDAVAGLWATLGCLIVASFEVILGISSCGAGLRYSDMVDKFKAGFGNLSSKNRLGTGFLAHNLDRLLDRAFQGRI